jgi:hypothetical protein
MLLREAAGGRHESRDKFRFRVSPHPFCTATQALRKILPKTSLYDSYPCCSIRRFASSGRITSSVTRVLVPDKCAPFRQSARSPPYYWQPQTLCTLHSRIRVALPSPGQDGARIAAWAISQPYISGRCGNITPKLVVPAEIKKLKPCYHANRIAMPKKRKDDADSEGLWVAQKYSLKGPTGDRAWENRPGGIPSHSRFLELADIALGVKKPHGKKRKTSSSPHATKKTEPYST